MSYAVVWAVTAIARLTQLEQTAGDPARIRAAANRIDFALRRTPHDMGESREPGWRLWYEDVLGVRYVIDDERMRVDVFFVGPARRR